jgi:hypothetical protein
MMPHKKRWVSGKKEKNGVRTFYAAPWKDIPPLLSRVKLLLPARSSDLAHLESNCFFHFCFLFSVSGRRFSPPSSYRIMMPSVARMMDGRMDTHPAAIDSYPRQIAI